MAGTFFILGCLFLMLAFTFLPIILISPGKFNLFFSMGSICIQLSLAFYYGPLHYVKEKLLKKENIVISLLYLVSLIFAAYASLFWGSYLTSLFMIGL